MHLATDDSSSSLQRKLCRYRSSLENIEQRRGGTVASMLHVNFNSMQGLVYHHGDCDFVFLRGSDPYLLVFSIYGGLRYSAIDWGIAAAILLSSSNLSNMDNI